MSELLKRLKKNSTIKESSSLEDSSFFDDKDFSTTQIPMLNVALSGKLDGGLVAGLTTFAGPSRSFKTGFALMMAKAYLDKHDDAVILFYDSEFGASKKYFSSFGIDSERVLHCPLLDMEQFKFDIMHHFDSANKEGIKKGDHIFIMVDSLGNLASKKEVDDATEANTAADMTRAKVNKSIFRMITPHLRQKNIPMVVIQHTYQTMDRFPKTIVSGGQGTMLSSDTVFTIGRQQDKDNDKELLGFNFILNVEKSRTVKEKSKIAINISFEGGMSKWSGLMEEALESGHVVKPKNGWYAKVDQETGEVEKNHRLADTNTKEFWTSILENKKFKDVIEKKYALGNEKMVSDDDISNAYKDVEGDDDE